MAKRPPLTGANDLNIIPPHRRCKSDYEVPEPSCGVLTEGYTIEQAFTRLNKEALAVLYRLFQTGAHEHLPPTMEREFIRLGLWKGFAEEQNGIQDRVGLPYGLSLERALRIWNKYTVRIQTVEEAQYANRRRGYEVNGETLAEHSAVWYRTYCEETKTEVDMKRGLRRYRVEQCLLPDLTTEKLIEYYRTNPLPNWYANGTVPVKEQIANRNAPLSNELEYIQPGRLHLPQEQTFTKWVEVFLAEVHTCVARFVEDPDLPNEIARLVHGLANFKVCSFEGKPLRDVLAQKSAGKAFLSAMDRQRDRLAQRLADIADEWPVDLPSNEQEQRLTWKGNTMELAALIDLLERKGWVKGGRSRSQLAQRVAVVFSGSGGEPLELSTLKTYLGKAYRHTPREGVEFTASSNPDKTQ